MKPFHSWLQECVELSVWQKTSDDSNPIRVTDGSSVRFNFYFNSCILEGFCKTVLDTEPDFCSEFTKSIS
jgi:hypothetical protein